MDVVEDDLISRYCWLHCLEKLCSLNFLLRVAPAESVIEVATRRGSLSRGGAGQCYYESTAYTYSTSEMYCRGNDRVIFTVTSTVTSIVLKSFCFQPNFHYTYNINSRPHIIIKWWLGYDFNASEERIHRFIAWLLPTQGLHEMVNSLK